MKPYKSDSILRKFKNSLNGFRFAFLRERAILQESLVALFLVLLALIKGIVPERVALVFFASLLPMSLELVNSAVEMLIDNHFGDTWREDIRRTKDMLSASVLVAILIGYGASLWLIFLD